MSQVRVGLAVIILISFFLLIPSAWANSVSEESYQTWKRYYSNKVEPDFASHYTIAEYKNSLILFDNGSSTRNYRPRVFRWENDTWSALVDNQWDFFPLRGSITWRDKLIVVAIARSRLDRKTLRLPAWDGAKWTELDWRFSGKVSALVEWQGDLVVAGQFTIEGIAGDHRLARWDGSEWTIIPAALDGPKPSIEALAVYKNELVIGGSFVAVGQVNAINLASLGKDGWHSLGPGANATVNKLTVFKDELYVAGNFTCIGGLSLSKIARWNGSNWQNLGVDVPLEKPRGNSRWPFVSNLKATDNGLLVTGKFQQVNGYHCPSMALWDGEQWEIQTRWGPVPSGALPPIFGRGGPKFAPPPETQEPIPSQPKNRELLAKPKRFFPDSERNTSGANIQCIAEVNGTVFVTHNAGSSHNGYKAKVSVWSDDAWLNLPSFEKPSTSFRTLGSYRGELLVMHSKHPTREGFLKICNNDSLRMFLDLPSTRIGRWHVTDEEILVFGYFRHFAGQPMNAVARFDGLNWNTMGVGIPFDSSKFEKIAGSGDNVFVAGNFKNMGFLRHECILHWDGSRWHDILELDKQYTISDMIAWKDGLVLAEYRSFGYEEKQDETKTLHLLARKSHSRIRYWDGDKWTIQWEGDRGFISALASDGERLLCAWAKNEGPSLLEWVNGRWHVLAESPLAGPSLGEMNNISDLTIYRGEPLVGGHFHDGTGGEAFGLAIWRDGHWWQTKDTLAKVTNIVGTRDYLWVDQSSRRFANVKKSKSEKNKNLRSGVFLASWQGELNDVQMVEPGSIKAAISLRNRCVKKTYRGPALVNLPWPSGIKFQKRESDLPPLQQRQQPGWRLPDWPSETTADSLVQSSNGEILIPEYSSLPNHVNYNLQFCFKAEASSRYAVSFDFKITNPQAWQDSTVEYLDGPNNDVPRWSYDQNWPYVELKSGHSYAKGGRLLYPMHDGWNTARFSTKMIWDGQFLALSFVSRGPKDYAGEIEIRNLNIVEINPTAEEVLNDLKKTIKANYLPVPGVENDPDAWLNLLGRELGNADPDSVYTIIKRSWGGIFDPSIETRNRYNGGTISILRPKYLNTEVRKKNKESIRRHLINWQDGRGWVADGIAYYNETIAKNLTQDFYLDQSILVTDWQALILDFRSEYSTGEHINSSSFYSKGPSICKVLSGTDFIWGYLTKGPDMNLENARPLIVKVNTEIKLPPQIFVLTDEFTSGSIVEMLKHIPRVTTVGCPSWPITRPNEPFPLQDGGWLHLPINWIVDADGSNISNQRIIPDILIDEGAPYDAPLLKVLEVLGVEVGEPQFCPVD